MKKRKVLNLQRKVKITQNKRTLRRTLRLLDPSKKKKVEPKAKGKASRRKPTVEIGEQMNSDEDILDYSSESDSYNEEDVDKNDSKEEGKGKKKIMAWKKGGWKLDPSSTTGMSFYGPKLSLPFYSERDELDYFLHFLPQQFIKTVLLPAVNSHGQESRSDFQDIIFKEFIKVLGIFTQ